MKQRPTLQTERLVLRPFSMRDAPAVQALAGDRRIATTTLLIPHPYKDGMAEKWIATHQEDFEREKNVTFAITLRADGLLLGAIGLKLDHENEHGELGYWIGVPYWNQGYCSEAAAAVLRHGFETQGLHRIYAHHFARNPASGRVLQKLGMTYEGRLRHHVRKWEAFEDLEQYGVLKDEFRPT